MKLKWKSFLKSVRRIMGSSSIEVSVVQELKLTW